MRGLFEQWFGSSEVHIPGLGLWESIEYKRQMEKAFRKGFNAGKKAAKKLATSI